MNEEYKVKKLWIKYLQGVICENLAGAWLAPQKTILDLFFSWISGQSLHVRLNFQMLVMKFWTEWGVLFVKIFGYIASCQSYLASYNS